MLRFEEGRCEGVMSFISLISAQEEPELCTSITLAMPASNAITKNNEQKASNVPPLTLDLTVSFDLERYLSPDK